MEIGRRYGRYIAGRVTPGYELTGKWKGLAVPVRVVVHDHHERSNRGHFAYDGATLAVHRQQGSSSKRGNFLPPTPSFHQRRVKE